MPRPDLTMDPAVRAAFLAEERVLRLAVVDADGWPDVVPLWFVHHADPRGELWIWNLTRSRRTADLARGARCGVTVDGGEAYAELRGLTARTDEVGARTGQYRNIGLPSTCRTFGRYASTS